MDTYADDFATVIDALDLKGATLVGHSTGGGEVAHYIGRHGSARVAKAVLIGAVPPIMAKTESNPGGRRSTCSTASARTWRTTARSFTKTWRCRSSASIAKARRSRKVPSTSSGIRACSARSKASTSASGSFRKSTTPPTCRIDVPTLILHGDDDQIVPINASGRKSPEIVKNATLKVYAGGSHGMCVIEADKVNADLLAFLQG